jgi:hypothetical protein
MIEMCYFLLLTAEINAKQLKLFFTVHKQETVTIEGSKFVRYSGTAHPPKVI